jgi:hypothetical protein
MRPSHFHNKITFELTHRKNIRDVTFEINSVSPEIASRIAAAQIEFLGNPRGPDKAPVSFQDF